VTAVTAPSGPGPADAGATGGMPGSTGSVPAAGDGGTAGRGRTADTDLRWMREAIALSRRCSASPGAYSVGAVVVGADGVELARGFSRETDPRVHAEEAALDKLAPDDPRLPGATVYSTLEPCTDRRADRIPCTDRIIAAGPARVVIAWREPDLFADCQGVARLTAAGIEVVELSELADEARQVNTHLPGIGPGEVLPGDRRSPDRVAEGEPGSVDPGAGERRNGTSTRRSGRGERPQFAGQSDRRPVPGPVPSVPAVPRSLRGSGTSPGGVRPGTRALVGSGEVGGPEPGLERFLVPPPGDDQPGGALVRGPQ
jgi:diaminohydroxyphosphoribosylaminopyrimidine deaminase / 5-amino-6-(5-phosphoribosylamino)uracil reductase